MATKHEFNYGTGLDCCLPMCKYAGPNRSLLKSLSLVCRFDLLVVDAKQRGCKLPARMMCLDGATTPSWLPLLLQSLQPTPLGFAFCQVNEVDESIDAWILLVVSLNVFKEETNPGSLICGCFREGSPPIPCGFFLSKPKGCTMADECIRCHNCCKKRSGRRRAARLRHEADAVIQGDAENQDESRVPIKSLTPFFELGDAIEALVKARHEFMQRCLCFGIGLRHTSMWHTCFKPYERALRDCLTELSPSLRCRRLLENHWANRTRWKDSDWTSSLVTNEWKEPPAERLELRFQHLARCLMCAHAVWARPDDGTASLMRSLQFLRQAAQWRSRYACDGFLVSEIWAASAIFAEDTQMWTLQAEDTHMWTLQGVHVEHVRQAQKALVGEVWPEVQALIQYQRKAWSLAADALLPADPAVSAHTKEREDLSAAYRRYGDMYCTNQTGCQHDEHPDMQ